MIKNTITTAIVIAAVIGGIILFAGNDGARKGDISAASADSVGGLTIDGAADYDFGRISMAAGIVRNSFKLKNSGPEPITVSKIYTSCMCTTATFDLKGNQFGPFGMPGHVSIPKINQVMGPGEEAVVEVAFDPAAHGPAGIGRITRTITVENSPGRPIEIKFSAVVAP